MATPPGDLLETIGNRVRTLRKSAGLTAREVAERAGLSLRFYSLLEAGRANIAVGRLQAVAGAFGVPLAQLVAEDAPGRKAPKDGVALLGLRGAGKSTIGPRVARALALPFVELDERIEESAGLGLDEIFALHGEAYYRRLTGQCLDQLLSRRSPSVVALPGGIVLDEGCFDLVRRRCTTVWLKARPEEHMVRVLRQGDRRPVADRPNAMAELRSILAAREPLYACAEISVDTSRHRKDEAARSVVSALERLGW